jgi:hypothetical protein
MSIDLSDDVIDLNAIDNKGEDNVKEVGRKIKTKTNKL